MNVTAVVLAAGRSTRMGSPKMLLRWGNTTVLGHVLNTLRKAGLERKTVVLGSDHGTLEEICRTHEAMTIFNPAIEASEMLSSLQIGLVSLPAECQAALVVLGDQPSLQVHVVRAVLQRGDESSACLVLPSYRRRRGHPWLVGSDWWQEILRMRPPETSRDFLHRHAADIGYVEVETDSILRDIDTPDDYLKSAP